jgi:hypothetical protein
MLYEQFEQQDATNSIEMKGLNSKNVPNTVGTAVSSYKMLQIPPKCYIFFGK